MSLLTPPPIDVRLIEVNQSLTPQGFTSYSELTSTNITESIVSIQGNYSSAITNNGLVIITGEVILGNNFEASYSLDDRINDLWSAGNLVAITAQINGVFTPIPVLGKAFIENSFYDNTRESQSLRLNLTCALGYYNRFTPGELGICVNIEDGLDKTVAISTLLNKAGIPNNKISVSGVTGKIKRSIVVGDQQSFIGLAGEIAFAGGGYLYQDFNGIIQFRKFTASSTTFNFTRAFSSKRTSNNNIPICRVKIIGNNICKISTTDGYSYSTNFNTGGFNKREFVSKTISPNRRRITTTTETTIANFAPSRTTITEQYQSAVSFSTDPEATLENCVPKDEAKLVSRKTVVKRAYGDVLQAFLSVVDEAINPAPTFPNETQIITAEIIEENWVHPPEIDDDECSYGIDGTNSAARSTVAKGSYRKRVRRPRGVLYPEIGDRTLGRGGNQFVAFVFETQLSTAEIVEEQYTYNGNLWSKTTQVYRNVYQVDPAYIQRLQRNVDIPLISVTENALRIQAASTNLEADSSPPSAPIFPADFREVVEDVESEINVSVYGRNCTTTNINLGDFIDAQGSNASAFTRQFISQYIKLLNGKTKGVAIQAPLLPEFFSVRPLDTALTLEPQYSFNYYIDNLSIAITRNEAVLGFNGSYSSYFDFGGIVNYFCPDPNNQSLVQYTIDNEPVEPDAIGLVNYDPNNYTPVVVGESEGGSPIVEIPDNPANSSETESFVQTPTYINQNFEIVTDSFILGEFDNQIGEALSNAWDSVCAKLTFISRQTLTTICGTTYEGVCFDGSALVPAVITTNCGTTYEGVCFEDVNEFQTTINVVCGVSYEGVCFDGTFGFDVNVSCGTTFEGVCHDGAITSDKIVETICGNTYEGVCFEDGLGIPPTINTLCATTYEGVCHDGELTSDTLVETICGTTYEGVCHDGEILQPANIVTVCGTTYEGVCHDGNFETFATAVCGTTFEGVCHDGAVSSDVLIETVCGTTFEGVCHDGNTVVDTTNIAVYGLNNNTDIQTLVWDDGTGNTVYVVDEEQLPN